MKNNNQIQHFHNMEFGSLDILMIEDKPYFPATECAHVLGYKDPAKAIRMHCKGVDKMATPSAGGIQMKNFIPEGDLYRLIIRSKLPAAERFEMWVFDEVLPSIRKHGAYISTETLEDILRDRHCMDKLVNDLKLERNKTVVLESRSAALTEENAALEELAVELAPKALYCDIILQCKNAVPVTLIAKDYGFSAVSFNKILHAFGIQYKMRETWLLYQEFAGEGYTITRTYQTKKKIAVMHTCWTQKGRLFLGMDADSVAAWTYFVAALSDTAKRQKRVVLREKPLAEGDSEKFAMRVFLLRLGFIGPESKEARRIILANLPGDGSHKSAKRAAQE